MRTYLASEASSDAACRHAIQPRLPEEEDSVRKVILQEFVTLDGLAAGVERKQPANNVEWRLTCGR